MSMAGRYGTRKMVMTGTVTPSVINVPAPFNYNSFGNFHTGPLVPHIQEAKNQYRAV